MAIVYKIDIIAALKDAGWSSYRITKERLIPTGTLQRLREGEAISFDSLDKICSVLHMQPGDIIEHIDTNV